MATSSQCPVNCSASNPSGSFCRLILTNKVEAQAMTTDAIIKKVLNAVPVP
jgi:hypothetical protein